jgi:CheY-like chemotaxis protein
MKVFWLISLLFSFAFGIHSQIIVGAYNLESTALKEEKSLQMFLDKDKDFFEKNSIVANHKQNNKYFLVTAEPIADEHTLATALQKIKVKYKHAYILKLAVVEPAILAIEPLKQEENVTTVNETSIETPLIESNITAEEANTTQELQTQEAIPMQEEVPSEEKALIVEEKVFVQESTPATEESPSIDYQTIGFALLTLFILAALLFFLKISSKKESQETAKVPEPKHTHKEIEIEDTDTSTTDEMNLHELSGVEEGDFIFDGSVEETQKSTNVLKKRTIKEHGKILKQDFHEFAGTRILVAEDNLINQKVITGLLADSGIEVLVANNGKEALDILEKDNNFAIILMDAHMPIMDGFEATKAIRENSQLNHIAIVALSGDVGASDIKKMLDAGMDEHLEKPLRIDALYDVVYAYTDFEEQNAELQHQLLNNDLNTEKGLITCSGDEDFYHEILNEFLQTYADSDTKIFQYLDAGDYTSADKYLLDIVSVSSHIGADKLNAVAKELKETLHDTEEKSYLTLAHHYSELLHKLIQSIHEYK